MYGAINRIFLTAILVLFFCMPAASLAKSGKRLMTINAIEYTNEDFVNWWKHWSDNNGVKVLESPDDFIAFQLMVQQGTDMEYDSKPSYLRKIDVFLQVRTMVALKYEEIDSKVNLTDADLKKYFKENYSDIWILQILSFDSELKAQNAYNYMLPFKGQVAGRLVFADLYGAGLEEKADTYDESRVSVADFRKNKRDGWLSVVQKLEPGEVSQPILTDDGKKYVLLRLVEKQTAGEDVFSDKKQRMAEVIIKEKKNQLTFDLIEKLKSKYKVQVNRELFNEVKLDVEYPKEFLDRELITMSDFKATVNDLIYNANKEKNLRKGIADEIIKGMVLDSIISQTLITKESLARGYEKRPPLLATYEYYKQSRLKAEVESGLMATVVISDQDIKNYYDTNIVSFSISDKFTYFLLEGDEDVLKRVWLGTLQGGDFVELAQKYSLDARIQTQGVDSLPPLVVSELRKVDNGGVSLPFMLGGKYGLIKVVEYLPGQVQPLAQVKSTVLEQLKKAKFEIIKAEYLSKLKSRSQIDINERVWKGLMRELNNGKQD